MYEIMSFCFCSYNVFNSYKRFYEFSIPIMKNWSVLSKSAKSNVQSKIIPDSFCNRSVFLFWLIVFSSFLILKFSKITELLHLWLPKRSFSVLQMFTSTFVFSTTNMHARSKSAFLFMKLWFLVFHGNAQVCSFFHETSCFSKKTCFVKEKMLHFFSQKKSCKNHAHCFFQKTCAKENAWLLLDFHDFSKNRKILSVVQNQ